METSSPKSSEINGKDLSATEVGQLFASPAKRQFVLALALVALTLLVYAPIRNYPFITYDDNLYVTQNIPVQSGLTWKSIAWAFTTVEVANYHPITWLSHELDVQMFGLNPAGHHLTSLLLHSANVLLLFLLLARATGSIWRGAAVAALFAVHPLNVQSVAWISERKNLLSTFFGLWTWWAYGWYAFRPNVWRYMTMAALFALSLLSKAMLVTLPFALLLIDYWPLHRFPESLYFDSDKASPLGIPGRSIRSLVAEKIPLLALIAASAWLTFRAQRLYAGSGLHVLFPLRYRIENRVFSYAAAACVGFAAVVSGDPHRFAIPTSSACGRLVLVPWNLGSGDRLGAGRCAGESGPVCLPDALGRVCPDRLGGPGAR